MVNNISFKPQVKFNVGSKVLSSPNSGLTPIQKDTISFSSKVNETGVSQKEIRKRVKKFTKLMKGQPIPPEVMNVLKDPNMPVALPVETGRAATIGIIRSAIKKTIESIMPRTWSEPLVKKIAPESLLNDINVVAVRLNKMKILDKSEGILRGNGECYFLSMVTDGVSEPAILRVETFNNIKDGDDLFDKGLQRPFTVFLSDEGKVPRLLDFRLLIMEADEKGSKKASEILDAITGHEDYKKIIIAIRELVKAAAPAAAIFTLLDSAMGIVKRILKTNEDDQLLYYAARFTKDFDNLGVGSYNNKYDKVELGYEILAK